MTDYDEGSSSAGLPDQRLCDLLERLAQRGLTQNQVATNAGLPPQYVSDIKRGRRPMTELVARRLGEKFDVNYQWLMGISDSMEHPQPRPGAMSASGALWLPLFTHPIEGEPRTHPQWDGAGIEVSGGAAARLISLKLPYVLRFEAKDVEGRLQKGDLVLISQAASDRAEIHVVCCRKKCYLARAQDDGSLRRLANGQQLSRDCRVVGHCVGIVWSPLT